MSHHDDFIGCFGGSSHVGQRPPGTCLATAYRPRKPNELIGQMDAVTLLNNIDPDLGTPPLLIIGPSGSGKSTSGKLAAKQRLCESDPRPCGRCSSCLDVEAGGGEAYHEIDAASCGTKEALSRIFDERLRYPPIIHRRHVVFIDEAGSLSRPAQDFLLKTMEQNKTVIFIFALIDQDSLPIEFRNRCTVLRLRPSTFEDRKNYVERICRADSIDVLNDAQELIARHAPDYRTCGMWLERLCQATPMGNIDSGHVRSVILPERSSVALQLLLACLAGDGSSIDHAVEPLERLSPDQKFEAVLLGIQHVGRVLTSTEKPEDRLFCPSATASVMDGLRSLAASREQSSTELLNDIEEEWIYRPPVATDAIFEGFSRRFQRFLMDAHAGGRGRESWGEAGYNLRSDNRGRRRERRRRIELPARTEAYLTTNQVHELVEASTFMLQQWGAPFSSVITVEGPAAYTEQQMKATCTEIGRQLAAAMLRWGRHHDEAAQLHRVSCLWRNQSEHLGAYILFHLPEVMAADAKIWLENFTSRIRDDRQVSHLKVNLEHRTPSERKRVVDRHWKLLRLIIGMAHLT